MWKAWRRANARVAADLPAGEQRQAFLECPPGALSSYDCRHTFGTEVTRITGTREAAKELLQHADVRTTERYTLGERRDR